MCVSTRIPFDNKLSEMQIGGEHLSFPVIRFWFRRADCGGRDDRRSGWLYGRLVCNNIIIDNNNVYHGSPRHPLRFPSRLLIPALLLRNLPSSCISAFCHFSGLCQHLELNCLVTALARVTRARACANRD